MLCEDLEELSEFQDIWNFPTPKTFKTIKGDHLDERRKVDCWRNSTDNRDHRYFLCFALYWICMALLYYRWMVDTRNWLSFADRRHLRDLVFSSFYSALCKR